MKKVHYTTSSCRRWW